MFSSFLSSASSYFRLPVDDDADLHPPKHIAWQPSHLANVDGLDPHDFPSTSSFATSHHKDTIADILLENDLYRVLGLQCTSRNIDKLTLRRAYLARSKACHPDKFPNNPEATRAFQKLSVAYNVLSKPSSKRLYDSRPPHSPYDPFSARPFPPPDETFRTVVIGVFNDILDGDLDMIRTLLKTVNDVNPALRMGDEGINSVLVALQSIRDRALICRACVLALNAELTRLLEVQRAFHDLSYFDLRRRSCLTIRLARLMISLPIALEYAITQQRLENADDSAQERGGVGDGDRTAIVNRRIYTLLRSLVRVLERMEQILK